MNKRIRWAAAGILPLALIAAACGGSDNDVTTDTTTATTTATTASPRTTVGSPTPTSTIPPKATEVTIRPLFTRGDEGGVGTEVVRLGPSPDGSLRVDFSEDEVSGLGDQSRAASWSAVTVATLLSGAPLEGRYEFEISGPIDGPSAGALKTVAVLSLLHGEELDADVTMTGTVNPDGTVGPVGGIPEKVLGAAEEGIETVLIPVGQRNSISKATGELVDVVDLGRREGVEVVEVTDVYQAYTELTGESLPRLEAGSDTKLDAKAYDRLKAQADAFLASFNQSAGVFASLDPDDPGDAHRPGRRGAGPGRPLRRPGPPGSAGRRLLGGHAGRGPRRRRRGVGAGRADPADPGHRSLPGPGRLEPGHRGRGVRPVRHAEDLRAPDRERRRLPDVGLRDRPRRPVGGPVRHRPAQHRRRRRPQRLPHDGGGHGRAARPHGVLRGRRDQRRHGQGRLRGRS